MLLRTITKILAEQKGFSFSKNTIWDTTNTQKAFFYRVENIPIHAYLGVRLSLEFDYKYTYLSFSPAYRFRDSDKYSKTALKAFADLFSTRINGKKPN